MVLVEIFLFSQYWQNVKYWIVWLPVLKRDLQELYFNKFVRKPQFFFIKPQKILTSNYCVNKQDTVMIEIRNGG